MKRFFMLTVLTVVIVLMTACNNVNKPTYNGNLNDSSFLSQSDGAVSSNSSITDTPNNNSLQNESEAHSSQATSSTADGHTHQFKGATCTEPKICMICGATEGEPKHRWIAANCMEPKTCIECNKKGDKLAEHIYIDGECNVCHQRDPNFEYVPFESAEWVAHIIKGEQLYKVVINCKDTENANISYTLFENLSDTAESNKKLLYEYNGQKYIKKSVSEHSAVTFVDKGGSIDVADSKNNKLYLERISECDMVISRKVTSFLGYEKFLQKGVSFTAVEAK